MRDGLGRRLAAVCIFRPVVQLVVIIVRVFGRILLRVVKRLVRVKGIDQQEPVVVRVVLLHPVGRAAQRPGRGIVPLAVKAGAVAHILRRILPIVRPRGQRAQIGRPDVGLLPAEEFPRIEDRMVVLPAQMEVMVVVGDHMAEIPVPAQHIGQRAVKRLDWCPVALKEVDTSGQQIMPRRHARRRADKMVVEHAAARGETVHIRGAHPVVPIGRQEVPVEAVHQNDDRFHCPSPRSSIRARALAVCHVFCAAGW